MTSQARKAVLPESIGRYAITGLLGKGGQGVVLCAHDQELDRQVAIKLLRPKPDSDNRQLANEARIVSRLQHPNIVTLHDIGIYRGMHYLVFEYIDGVSLGTRIKTHGAIPFAESVIMMSQILAGVAYLHEHDVIHRDLSPGNILLTREGTPKVTDFGISVLRQVEQSTAEVSGTLRYMAPEPFADQIAGTASDVFTLSSIFFEMLTGKRRFDENSPSEIIKAIVSGPAIDLAASGIDIDARVAHVLATASARPLSIRYGDARAMKNELDQFRLPRDRATAGDETHGTVDFLMRRMGHKTGFSALSQHIGELLQLTAEESLAPASRLVNILAKDMTLTQRVLSQANSAYYGKAEITALAAAVSMLGLDQVRTCITSALLESEFEQGSPPLRDALLKSFHSAILAKALAPVCAIDSRAEAFTCALFHDLGRTLTVHYFAEEFAAIQAYMVRMHADELTASRQILGIPYHDLGAAVGVQWKLSRTITDAMRPLPRGCAPRTDSGDSRLQLCTAYANAISRAIAESDDAEQCVPALAGLAQKVDGVLCVPSAALAEALEEAASLSERYAALLKIDRAASAWAERLIAFRGIA